MIEFVRRSPFTGKVNSMVIDVTEEQVARWEAGVSIQHAMPNVSPEHREFILTGITPEEWANTFGEEQLSNPPAEA